MGKRQVRIFRKDLGPERESLLQKEAHLVMRSARVFRGLITELAGDHLTLLNHRLQPHTLDLAEIEEIVYDRETEY
ncbi:hypothetical protein BH24BAC1_BH24BAC1_06150 [soil metagenome]